MTMRVAREFRVRPGAAKSVSTSLPAPVGGLNARDAVSNMAVQDAVELENFFPKSTSVEVRNGTSSWNTFTGICQTLMAYNGHTSSRLFAGIRNGTVYSIMDATSSGPISSPVVGGTGPVVQALTNTRFDFVNFGTAAGMFMTVVNGADTAVQYNGSTWSTVTLTHAELPSTAQLFTVGVYAQRMWFGRRDTFDIFYLPTQTISGAMQRLNVGSLFKLGGSLSSIVTLTDATRQVDDYIAFISTEGEIIAFTGTDPASASTWRMAAHFRVGRPVIKGNRAWCKLGSDALLLCADGVYPIRTAIQENSRSGGLAVSSKIRNTINGLVAIHGNRFGWQAIVHPTGGKLIVNIPTAEDVSAIQYVMNIETGAWCKYTGWNAFTFEVDTDTLYYGGNGRIVKADTGDSDLGSAITAYAKQAFNYFGTRGRAKQMKLVRPIVAANGQYKLGIDVDVDYEDSPPTYLRTINGGSGDPWGGIWDVTWSGGMVLGTNWYGVNGIGHAIALVMKIEVNNVRFSWSATDTLYEVGGVVA